MARNTWKQYRQIISKPVPACGGGAFLFAFGVECTQIITDTADTQIVRSRDMCINPEGLYTSASYRAYPGKTSGGNLLFSSTLTGKPELLPVNSRCDRSNIPAFCF